MPPKKDKKSKKKQEPVKPPVLDITVSMLGLPADDREFDLINDVNDDFFSSSNKIIEFLMRKECTNEALKFKQYAEIIQKLHRRYIEERDENMILRPKISDADDKIRLALELTSHSEECTQRLKDSIVDIWREVDAFRIREQDMQLKLQDVLLKCAQYETKEVSKTDDDSELGNLAKYKGAILRERDRLNGEVLDLEKRIQMQRLYTETLEYVNKNLQDDLNKTAVSQNALRTEKASLQQKLWSSQNAIEELKDINGKTSQKLNFTNTELSDVKLKLQNRIDEVDRLKISHEKLRSDNLIKARKLAKNDDEIKELYKEQSENSELIRSLRLDEKIKANIINELNLKLKNTLQDKNVMSTKLYQMNRSVNQLKEDIARLKNQIYAREKDIVTAGQKYDDLWQVKEGLVHDRENLRSDIIKLNNQISDLKHTIIMNTIHIDGLNLEIKKLNVKLDESKTEKEKLSKERDELSHEVVTLYERIENYEDMVQLKTEQITNLTEDLQKKQHALINMKKQLDSMQSEKIIMKRALDMCTQERNDFRNLNMRNAHQIEQQTTEINNNYAKITKLNLTIDRLNNEKKQLETDLKNTEDILARTRKDLRDMRTKNENLLKTINDDEKKFIKLSTELEETRKERNLVGLQMVRRNDELILIKEKLSISQNALDNGITQYNQRVEDIRILKMEISNLQTERDCLSRALSSTCDMRQEVINLQRLLNQERVRVRALVEDIKTPTGVHRWRLLKGEDPNKFELLRKVQTLQKRCLKQDTDKLNLQNEMKHLQELNQNLKRIVENMPEDNIKAKLVKQQRINRQKEKQLKCLKAELAVRTVESGVKDCKITELKAVCAIKNIRSEVGQTTDAILSSENPVDDPCNVEHMEKRKISECYNEITLYNMSKEDLTICSSQTL